MKILAGGQFHKRKPRLAAPNTQAAAELPLVTPKKIASAAAAHVMNTASDAAIPSMPSMKLYRFRAQTIPTVSTTSTNRPLPLTPGTDQERGPIQATAQTAP